MTQDTLKCHYRGCDADAVTTDNHAAWVPLPDDFSAEMHAARRGVARQGLAWKCDAQGLRMPPTEYIDPRRSYDVPGWSGVEVIRVPVCAEHHVKPRLRNLAAKRAGEAKR